MFPLGWKTQATYCDLFNILPTIHCLVLWDGALLFSVAILSVSYPMGWETSVTYWKPFNVLSSMMGDSVICCYPLSIISPRLSYYLSVSCPLGWERGGIDDQFCFPCRIGYYRERDDDVNCVPCPSGFTTQYEGSSSLEKCSTKLVTRGRYIYSQSVGWNFHVRLGKLQVNWGCL